MRQALADEVAASLKQLSLQHLAALQRIDHRAPDVLTLTDQGEKVVQNETTITQLQQASDTPFTPSLLETIDWATIHHIPQIENVHAQALSFTSATSLFSSLGTRAVILTFLSKLQTWGTITEQATSGFQERMDIQPIGRLHLERLDMTPAGLERGELVHSVPLTPKETVNISHKEWATTTQEFESIVQDFFEGYSEQGVAEKSDLSQSTESQSKHTTALNVGTALSASYSSVTLSASFGYNATSDDSQALKESRNHSVAVTR